MLKLEPSKNSSHLLPFVIHQAKGRRTLEIIRPAFAPDLQSVDQGRLSQSDWRPRRRDSRVEISDRPRSRLSHRGAASPVLGNKIRYRPYPPTANLTNCGIPNLPSSFASSGDQLGCTRK